MDGNVPFIIWNIALQMCILIIREAGTENEDGFKEKKENLSERERERWRKTKGVMGAGMIPVRQFA